MPLVDDRDRITFFFDDPSRPQSEHLVEGRASTLYLLRKELLDTLGYDPSADEEKDAFNEGIRHRAFASSMLMFTVLDLLAKFALGDEGKVGKRFIRFLRLPHGPGLGEEEAQQLYAVRNSMVHAFGLPHADELSRWGVKQLWVHRRNYEAPHMLSSGNGDVLKLYVDGFYQLVFLTIRARENAAKVASEQERALFREMFERYGSVFFFDETAG
jgi:hypothetical protein